MVMRLDVSVVASRADRARHLGHLAVGDEDLQIAIDRSERKDQRLGRQGTMDLGRGRMGVALLDPMKDCSSLTRAIATSGRRVSLGG